MELLNQKLWDMYDLQFPVDQDISLVIGENGSGKTHLLRHLADYFTEKGESVIYFPDERVFLHDPEEALEILQNDRKKTRLLELFEMEIKKNNYTSFFDIDPIRLELEKQYGHFIHQGKMQLANFLCSIKKAENESIIIIDEAERNLSITVQRDLIKSLQEMKNVKKIIVSTHSPCLINDLWDEVVDINNCIIKEKASK